MATGVLSAAWVGREAELGLLAGATRSVVAGRGGAVLVVGEPGIGKSALVARGLAGLPAGRRLVWGVADELTGRFPLLVLTDALGLSAAAVPAQGGAAPAGAGPGRGRTGSPAPWAVGDPVVAAIERVLSRVDELCAAGPVVLVVEDLHWADEASLLAFSRLVRAVRQQPLLVVGTARPVPPRPELGQLRRSLVAGAGAVVELGPLSEADSVELLGQLVGAAAGPRLGRLAAAAAGNPLYLREALDAVGRDGGIAVRGGVADLEGPPRPAVSLAAAISDRLAFLSADTTEALRVATLLGAEFLVTDLAAVTGRGPSELVRAVEEAVAAGVLAAAGERLRFRHALVRDALYGSMPEAIRAALHRQAGEALAVAGLPPERVAAQLLLAPPEADTWEAGWLAEHGAVLAEQAPEIAEQLLAGVVGHPLPDESRRDELELALVTAAFRRGTLDVLEPTALTILARAGDPEVRCQVVWLLAYALGWAERSDEALRLVEATASGEGLSPAWQARLRALRAMLFFLLGRYREADDEAAEALTAGLAVGDRTAAGYALHFRSVCAQLALDPFGAEALVHRALDVIGADDDLVDLRLLLLQNQVIGRTDLDRPEEAEAALHAARALADRTAPKRAAAIALAAAGLYYDMGRWDDALAELDAAEIQPYDTTYLTARHGMAALLAVRRDRAEDAAAELAAAAALTITSGDVRNKANELVQAQAAAAERAGDLAGALDVLRPTLDPELAEDMTGREDWMPDTVRLALAAGQPGLAAQAAEAAAEEAAREPRHGGRNTAARWCRALIDGDVAGLDGCADYFRRVGRLAVLGNVLEDAAATAATAGDAAGARGRLSEAVDVYVGLGAEWDVIRADSRLRALGVRRGRSRARRPVSGWAALTPTEARVAELVAEGRSNPDVAAVLFLSRRTVQTHVTHILAKLGIHSRAEIATASDRPVP